MLCDLRVLITVLDLKTVAWWFMVCVARWVVCVFVFDVGVAMWVV